ncbi:MAG: hypothetical protein J4215_01005 [Candidatus Diapherotrites archaeon]|uniref:Uncharacterized protein n=1 Tax=Candidatus Iainarchaeum sp. TaxID=3101447 RepID=A0A8T4L5K5_9ARCH|nr:hypothetical protein [Candidatus Diapherotrites archaeon]
MSFKPVDAEYNLTVFVFAFVVVLIVIVVFQPVFFQDLFEPFFDWLGLHGFWRVGLELAGFIFQQYGLLLLGLVVMYFGLVAFSKNTGSNSK